MKTRANLILRFLFAICTIAVPEQTMAQAPGACCFSFNTGYTCDDTSGSCVLPGDVYLGDGTSCLTTEVFDTVQECVGANGGILPVELTRFEAITGLNEMTLLWTTASEIDNAGFSVEHKVGSQVFTEIGFVEGHGTTDEAKEYGFIVNDLEPGVHQFRLKQIDFDGAFEYSPIVEAAITVPDRFLVEPAYPNPFNPSTTLRFAVASEQTVNVKLVNSTGQSVRTLYSGTVAANEMQTLWIDAAALPSGTYLVRFQGGRGFEAIERIVLTK